MVAYENDGIFPFPRERVWKLLNDHSDEQIVGKIHPLIKRSTAVARDETSVTFERTIDARGKLLTSHWKITSRPPELYRWDISNSEGPYANGSWMESTYTEEGGATRIRSRGELKISVLPFFLPQRPVLRRVLDDIDAEDQAYLRG